MPLGLAKSLVVSLIAIAGIQIDEEYVSRLSEFLRIEKALDSRKIINFHASNVVGQPPISMHECVRFLSWLYVLGV